MSAPTSANHLVWSSFTGPPERELSGYCFVGNDYVEGTAGLQQYQRETGRDVHPGEDGRYVSVTSDGSRTVFGTDAAGLHRLFYYSEGDTWCVSDSVVDMAEHLRGHGVTLTPDLAQLTGFSLAPTIAKQLASFHTMFEEIRLLPSWCNAVLTRGELSVISRESQSSIAYEEALHSFINTWTSRFETLLSHPEVEVRVELSGGTDSRAMLAIALAAARRSRHPLSALSFIAWSEPRWTGDWEAAANVGRQYGFEPKGSPSTSGGKRLSARESYAKWKSRWLGVYRPVYAPGATAHPTEIWIQGGSGENYRHFYPRTTYRALVDGTHKRVPANEFAQRWRQDVLEDLGMVRGRFPSLDPMVAHYREFRGRIHADRRSLYQTDVVPFASGILDRFIIPHEQLDGAQLNFDVMESLVPGLQDVPFDQESKAPGPQHKAAQTVVDLDTDSNPGQVYSAPARPETVGGKGFDRNAWLSCLSDDLREAFRPDVLALVGTSVADDASAVMAEAVLNGDFSHQTTAMNISSMIATDFALRATGR